MEISRAEPTVAATVAAARAATARAKMVMAAAARTPAATSPKSTTSPPVPTPAAPTATAAVRSTDAAKSLLASSGFRRVAAFVSAMRVPKDEASTQSAATITSKPAAYQYAAQKWLANAEDAANTHDDLNAVQIDRSLYLNEREPASPWKQRAESQDKPTAGVHSDSGSAAEVARREMAAHRIQYAVARYVERASLLSAARAATARAAAAEARAEMAEARAEAASDAAADVVVVFGQPMKALSESSRGKLVAQVAAAEARAVWAEACSGRLESRLAAARAPPQPIGGDVGGSGEGGGGGGDGGRGGGGDTVDGGGVVAEMTAAEATAEVVAAVMMAAEAAVREATAAEAAATEAKVEAAERTEHARHLPFRSTS